MTVQNLRGSLILIYQGRTLRGADAPLVSDVTALPRQLAGCPLAAAERAVDRSGGYRAALALRVIGGTFSYFECDAGHSLRSRGCCLAVLSKSSSIRLGEWFG